jgi:hypothetical protein
MGVLLLCCLVNLTSFGAAEVPYGRFVGAVVTEWGKDGRSMTLLKEFSYLDPQGKAWNVPAGTVVDGASIPQVFWTLIKGPFEGPYRNASVVHDYYCLTKSEPWQAVHRMFYFAMLAGGTSSIKAKSMYYAVLIGGPRWTNVYYTNHDMGAVPGPNDKDYYKMTPWEINMDKSRADQDLAWIENNDPSLEAIEQRAADTFRGTAPPDTVRLDKR